MKDFKKSSYLLLKIMTLLMIFSLIFSISCNRVGKIFLTSFPDIADSLPVLNIDKSEYVNTVNSYYVTMVHYFDGNCSSCIAELKMRSHYIDSIFKDEVGLIFVAHAKDTVILNYYLIDKLKFKFPVLYDEKSEFYEWNKQYIDNGVETFLVNKNGSILICGDPMANKEIENKYFNVIINHNNY